MPDQCLFKSKIPTRSPGPSAAECEGGLEAVSAWHDNQKSNSNPSPGATNECLKVLRQLSENALTVRACMASFFCIQQHLSSLSELITEPLVSGTKYHHATDGN